MTPLLARRETGHALVLQAVAAHAPEGVEAVARVDA